MVNPTKFVLLLVFFLGLVLNVGGQVRSCIDMDCDETASDDECEARCGDRYYCDSSKCYARCEGLACARSSNSDPCRDNGLCDEDMYCDCELSDGSCMGSCTKSR